MGKVCFGVDLGGTTVKLGILTEEGKIIDKWEIKTRTENNGAYILQDIADTVKEAIDQRGYKKEDIAGVGLGVPGPMMADGTVLSCVNLGWGTFNVAETLSKLLDLPVKAGNDANVAALGEQWQGGGKGHNTMVMVTLGTGVGGGIIINGQIHTGYCGAGGEIGHMAVIAPEDTIGRCNCGQTGCLEQAASATGIAKLAKRLVDQGEIATSLSGLDHIMAKDVFDAAKAGDTVGLMAVDKMTHYLGKALSILGAVINPEIFVIGGGVSKAGDFLLEKVKTSYLAQSFSALHGTEFALATLGNDAGMIGAARLVLQ